MVIAYEEYGVFFRAAGGHRSSVIVNLSIGDTAPLPHLPSLLRVLIAVPMAKSPTMGMPGENGTYASIELELITAMARDAGATFVARELTHGQMKFYFYAPHGKSPDPVISDVLRSFPTFRHRVSRIPDPEWTIYFDELYPTRIEFQLMRIQERRANAEAAGDLLEAPRPICHWAYFANPADREKFVERIRHRGFKFHLLERREPDTLERPYCVELARNDRADHPYLDDVVHWLNRQAEQCGGEYDGFEAESMIETSLNLPALQ